MEVQIFVTLDSTLQGAKIYTFSFSPTEKNFVQKIFKMLLRLRTRTGYLVLILWYKQ